MPESKEPDHSPGSDRERFLSVLNDITYAALEIQNFDELMQLLADRLAEIINADGCYLTLWDEETRTTIPVAAYGWQRDTYRDVKVEPNQPTLTMTTVDSGETMVIEDAWDPEFPLFNISRQFPSRGMLAIPIKAAGKSLGAALIAYERIHKFTPTEIDYCEQAVRQISLAIANVQSIEALKKSEQALTAREQHLYEAQEIAKMGSWEWYYETDESIWSEGMYRLLELEPQDEPPMNTGVYPVIHPSDLEKVMKFLTEMPPDTNRSELEFRTIHGRYLIGKIVRDHPKGRYAGTIQDVTEQRLLEAELFQARKMEAVGTLSGGIAHNFNNILTVIMGNYELLKDSIPEGTLEAKTLDQCLEATERAALLTRQLLVVSRNQELSPVSVDINSLITDLVNLLSPLVGEHINVSTEFCQSSTIVNADKGHLEQVFMNLVLNGRDALRNGGDLQVITREKPGDTNTILIEVIDNGEGIAESALPHIFDPFFTTKEVGKGTGLGLATVHSIIQQSGGAIAVDSTEGEGTRFTVELPITSTTSETGTSEVREPPVRALTSDKPLSILLIEDHESLRDIARFVLEKAGHKVIAAEQGEEAFSLIDEGQTFELIVSDVQLPGGMSGPELVEQITAKLGPMPTIFMSGLRDELPDKPNVSFLPKPFRPAQLLDAVNAVIRSLD